jgi:hypothetical protein
MSKTNHQKQKEEYFLYLLFFLEPTVGGQKYSSNMASVIWKIKIVVKETLILFTYLQYMSSPPVFSAVRDVQSLVFCVVFYRGLFVLKMLH